MEYPPVPVHYSSKNNTIMRVSLFLILLCVNSLYAQEYYSKLLSHGTRGERPKSINSINDSLNIITFTSHFDSGFAYGWMMVKQNGDTLSTFMFSGPMVRADGKNSLIVSGDTIFQLMKHRDSIHHIRVYATSISGDSLFRRDYDWVRPDWLIVYPYTMYRRQNGEFLIFGTVAKGGGKYDVFAIHIAPDGTEIRRNIIIRNFERIVAGPLSISYLYTHNVLENEDGYIISLRDWFHDVKSSSHIIFVDHELKLWNRVDNGAEGLGYDYNPIGFNRDSSGIYYSSSRLMEPDDIEADGQDWREVQNPTMTTGMLDLSGNLLWEHIMYVPYGNWMEPFSGKTTSNGDFVICGKWQKSGDYFGLVARFNDKGDLLFCYGFPLHPDPLRKALWLVDFVEDNSGALMLTGEVFASGPFSNKDIWLLRIPGHGCDPELMDCDIDSVVSSIRLLPDIDKSASGMTMYPNPIFPGQPIHLELSGVATGMADLRWLDMQGKQVHHEKVEIYENAPSLQVPSHLGAGWYMVELRDREGRSVSGKVVVWEKF